MSEEELNQAMKELIFLPKKDLIKALLNKQQEVQQLKNDNAIYEDLCDDFIKDKKELAMKLKQRDEVIEEAIKFIQEHTIVDNGLQLEVYDYEVADLLEILQKYKGGNNE